MDRERNLSAVRKTTFYQGDHMRPMQGNHSGERESVSKTGQSPTPDAETSGRKAGEKPAGKPRRKRQANNGPTHFTGTGECWACRRERFDLSQHKVCYECVRAVAMNPIATKFRTRMNQYWREKRCHS